MKGKSQKSFEHNVKTEMHHGKPQGQALAIAYSMKRKAQHKAMGGEIEKEEEHGGMEGGGGPDSPSWFGSSVPESGTREIEMSKRDKLVSDVVNAKLKPSAAGTNINQAERKLLQHDYDNRDMKYAHGGEVQEHAEHDPEHEDHMLYGEPKEALHKAKHEAAQHHAHGGVIHRVLKHFSKGGVVSNKGDAEADEQADQHVREYDDLVADDHLESTQHDYGDHDGDAAEDHDRHDIVARVLHSLAKKDKMPKGYPGL
jgi:hypothetical protein